MLSTISSRLTAILVSFTVLLAGVAAASHVVLKQQADDALVVNLAGRQRMLSQKMTKEASEYINLSREGITAALDPQRDKVQATMRAFEMTLLALKDGGPAPVNLELTKMRPVPAATAEVSKQLHAGVALWEPFKDNMNKVLQSKGTDVVAAKAVFDSNMQLMNQMNVVVDLMQGESEGKLSVLFIVQWVALAMGALLVGFGAWMARTTIALPLLNLAAAARSMSTGNLNVDLHLEGTRELEDLGASFDRMRASLVASMAGVQGNADDDL
jgi:methyl-accepting chemotaxis protein